RRSGRKTGPAGTEARHGVRLILPPCAVESFRVRGGGRSGGRGRGRQTGTDRFDGPAAMPPEGLRPRPGTKNRPPNPGRTPTTFPWTGERTRVTGRGTRTRGPLMSSDDGGPRRPGAGGAPAASRVGTGSLVYSFGVLLAINTMNFFDRQILPAVQEKIKDDWK